MKFADARKTAEDQGLLGKSAYLKLKEGDNRMRLLTALVAHMSKYQGRNNFKWLVYVIDRRDGKVKVFFMPHTIFKMIEALQNNPDYAFDEMPMPFDLTIYAKNAGTKEVEYSLIPARKETPLTAAEQADLAAQTPLDELHAKLRDKEKEQDAARGSAPAADARGETILDDDIPF